MSSNFRHHLLSLSLLVGIAAPWAAVLGHDEAAYAKNRRAVLVY